MTRVECSRKSIGFGARATAPPRNNGFCPRFRLGMLRTVFS
ncbi:hypothetical protein HMPREF1331_00236 [Enterococcus faecalis ERV25]|nr:hypothetical protein HMPREF1332_00702 [Enterococcus faecalis ERV31]EJV02887.1 hypothetical protein HMPREF1331_00236 [Enterococcus faecalis ERV25]